MNPKITAQPSRRWRAPEYHENGKHGPYWVARLCDPRLTDAELAAGLEPSAFGPDEAACVRETVRQDRVWAMIPAKNGDAEKSRERVAYLTGSAE